MNNYLSSYLYLFLIVLFFSFQACSPRSGSVPDTEPSGVKIIVANELTYTHNINTSGILSPYAELKLSFKTGGIIGNISVKEGQLVNMGETLAVLDLSEIRSHLDQAELMHAKAQRDYERINNLYADSVATLEQLQDARTALEIAASSESVARFNFDHSVIYAPVNGQILKILSETSEIVAPGSPVILFASSHDRWFLKVSVTDMDVVHINIGDMAQVYFDAHPDLAFEAKVSEMAGMADPYTGTFQISLEVATAGHRLMTGFIGRATIFTSKEDTYTEIPPGALVEANGRDGVVFKFEKGLAVRTGITIGEITDSRLLVTGLQSGDSIVVSGSRYIEEGQKLKISEN